MKKNKTATYLFAAMVILLLVSVRLFENEWFPEKLTGYFATGKYLEEPLPVLSFRDYFNIFLRFAVNSVLSVVLLHLLFNDRKLTLWAIRFLAVAGILVFVAFWLTTHWFRPADYRVVFYLRRVLIQPIGLFILLPVFYLSHLIAKNNENG